MSINLFLVNHGFYPRTRLKSPDLIISNVIYEDTSIGNKFIDIIDLIVH